MAYFECNLPKVIPNYYHPDIRDKLQETVDLVYARTEKLNEALAMSSLKPATFHDLAKKFFDISSKAFDEATPKKIAQVAYSLYDGTESPERVEWPNVNVFYDTAFVSTKDWEALRHFGIGGSDSSVIMGLSPYQSEEGLWFEKSGYPQLIEDDDGRQAIFDRGHYIEPTVIDMHCQKTESTLIPETRMFQSKKYPHCTANLDGVIRNSAGELEIFEAKSAIDVYAKTSEWYGDGVPNNYITQVHQYLGVMDDPRIAGAFIGMIPTKDIIVSNRYIGSEYDPSKYIEHYIKRDPQFEDTIMSTEEDFWQTYISARVKPDPSKSAGGINRKVALKYKPSPLSVPNVPPTTLPYDKFEDAFNRLEALEADYKAVKAQAESIQKCRENVRAEIIDAMGGAKLGLFMDSSGKEGIQVKATPVVRRSIDSDTLRAYYPEVYDKCVKTSSTIKFTTRKIEAKKRVNI